MLFPTAIFACFFALVYALHWALPERGVARKLALLAASIFFYAWWSWKFAIMLLVSAAVNHAAARYAGRNGPAPQDQEGRNGPAPQDQEGRNGPAPQDQDGRNGPAPQDKARRRILVAAVVANLALLAFFKYSHFLFMDVFHPLAVVCLRQFGSIEALIDFEDRILPFLDSIILPIGISFCTFQAISYVVDAYTGKGRPADSFLDFANYLAFFPKLCAGPIVRPSELLPQMETLPARAAPIDTGRAATLVLGGLFKKVVVANWIAQHLADPVFTDPESYGAIDSLLAIYGYAIQIYCDFSAYSDIATGCALLLGFKFPDNFRAPYVATSLQDFWRRWHITLSSWLRDYLYIPLGGSRCATWKIHRNLILTMLLGGLWHGAGWSYILWGAIHGVGQSIERLFRTRHATADSRNSAFGSRNSALDIAKGLLTFHVVAFAWIFFRAGAADAEGLATVRLLLASLSDWTAPATLLTWTAAIFLALGFALQALDGGTPQRLWKAFGRLHPVLQGIVAAILLTIILGLGPAGVAPFIYFQF